MEAETSKNTAALVRAADYPRKWPPTKTK